MRRSTLVLTVLFLSACASRPSPRTMPRGAPSETLALDEDADEEQRYLAIRALGRRHGAAARVRLRELAAAESAMLRNAAARTRLDAGDCRAAAELIRNLDREQRTFVVTDAIHHLRAVFGFDLGYEPNRGYRHQTERQAAWWAWFGRQRFGGSPLPSIGGRGAAPSAAERDAVARGLAALRAQDSDAAVEQDDAITALWTQVSEALAPSRHPEDVALVAEVFGELAERKPDAAALWNNHALASLNDGRWKAAELSYQRALSLTPADPQLRNDYGILLEALDRLEEAEGAYREALKLRPDDAMAAANLGDVLKKQGRLAEAVQAWKTAERLAPEKWPYHRLWLRRAGTGP